jgi:hypothetical protein
VGMVPRRQPLPLSLVPSTKTKPESVRVHDKISTDRFLKINSTRILRCGTCTMASAHDEHGNLSDAEDEKAPSVVEAAPEDTEEMSFDPSLDVV